MSKPKSKQEEALELLDDLDSFTPDAASTGATGKPAPGATNNEGEAEVLAFLDEVTRKSSEPTRPASHLERPTSRSSTPVGSVRKPTERVRLGGGTVSKTSSSTDLKAKQAGTTAAAPVDETAAAAAAAGSWGWGSVWNTASAALQQAKTAVDEQVKQLPKNEQARKWGEGVLEYAKAAQLDKLGQDFKRVGLSTLTDILNVVAPPISEHEIIQVWLSHDMRGYDGIESLTYRALARIMEQVEGGDLVVNRGDESRPKDTQSGRDLSPVEGFEAAVKLAQANLEDVMKTKNATKPETSTSSNTVPITYSYVFLRIQPFLTSYSIPSLQTPSSPVSTEPAPSLSQQHLQFLLYLSDPEHNITHSTITQSVPGNWLAIWDEYEWVEDLVAEALRVGVEVVGQEYIGSRMGWSGPTNGPKKALDQSPSKEVLDKPGDSKDEES